MTCSSTNTISEVLVVGGERTTTVYTESSSWTNVPPSNPPLYFDVTITAGLEKVTNFHATATSAKTTSQTSTSGSGSTDKKKSGAANTIVDGKLTLLVAWFVIAIVAL